MFIYIDMYTKGFPGGASGNETACQCRRLKETWAQSLGQENSLEEVIATHPTILAWRIPRKEDHGGWQATVHRVTKKSDVTEVT